MFAQSQVHSLAFKFFLRHKFDTYPTLVTNHEALTYSLFAFLIFKGPHTSYLMRDMHT